MVLEGLYTFGAVLVLVSHEPPMPLDLVGEVLKLPVGDTIHLCRLKHPSGRFDRSTIGLPCMVRRLSAAAHSAGIRRTALR